MSNADTIVQVDVKADETIASVQVPGNDELEYPENEIRAWVTLFGCFCAFFAALSLMNSAGAFQAWISAHQLSRTQEGKIGWIFGFYNFLGFFAALKAGPLFDRYGPRPLTALGTLLLLASYLLMAEATKYWHFFIVIGVLGGLGTCLLFTSALGTVQHWFMKRRGLATGIAISGGSVGGIALPLILGKLLPLIGFKWTARAIAAILLPFAVSGAGLLSSRFRSESSITWLPDLSILKIPRVLLVTLGACFIELAFFIPVTYLPSYAIANGQSSHDAYRLLTLLNVGSLVGRWLPGYVGDKLGRFNAQISALILCIVAILAIWLPADGETSMTMAFAIVFGVASGSNISLTPVCIAQLCPTEEYGRYYSCVYALASFGSLIGVPLAGSLIQAADGQYWGLMAFAASSYVASVICFVLVRTCSVGLVIRQRF